LGLIVILVFEDGPVSEHIHVEEEEGLKNILKIQYLGNVFKVLG
jgi:hypothetical protein